MASLQDQLLKAGMVDAKKAKQLSKEKRKAAKKQPKGQEQVNETREQVILLKKFSIAETAASCSWQPA